jgi:hypothetical protein
MFPDPSLRVHTPVLRNLSGLSYPSPLTPMERDMLLYIIFNQRVHDRYLGRQTLWTILWDSLSIHPSFDSLQEQIAHLALRFEQLGDEIMEYNPPVSLFDPKIRFPRVILPEDLPVLVSESGSTSSSSSETDQ